MNKKIALAGAAVFVSSLSHAQVQQQVRPPIAVYWMSVETAGGMGMSVPAGLGALMPSSMRGGRRIKLDLGSSQAASGDPRAAHAIPPGLSIGDSLPLVTPKIERPQSRPEPTGEREPPTPKGRMLIYWGCGEQVRAGQPVVFDFAKMDPQEAAKVFRSHGVSRPSGPAPGRNKSDGGWPNPENSTPGPDSASLRGAHVVSGNYSPEIRFPVDERHDFMDPVAFDPVRKTEAGALAVKWRAIPTATGYFATATGRGENETDVVMWSSSEVQDIGQSLMDYLPNAEVQRLIREKVILTPQTLECAVPAGIFKGEGAMFNFIAYGDEMNLVHPPRPADPKQPWNQEWAVKLRLKSTGMTLLSENAGSRGARPERATEAPAREAPPAAATPPSTTDAIKGGINVLRGIFGR